MGKRIGIDFGTTNSVVAVDDGPRVRILDSKEGRPEVRSVVSMRVRKAGRGERPPAPEILCGDVAMDNFEMAPEDTIISIKRLMGRGAEDPEVKRVRQWASYQIVQPSDGTKDSVRVVMGGQEYSPVDISAIILGKLKRDAEFRLGEEVTHAVITVPAYFSEAQRAATREAGIKAGLTVMKVLDEPTATAIAFGIDSQQSSEPMNILVYDLGGGTFDVSVLMRAGNVFAPLDFEGDMWLGGDNFDQVLVDHAIRHVKAEYDIDVMDGGGTDNRTRLRFLAALKKAAQATKERLSFAKSADLLVPGILKDKDDSFIDVEFEITRSEFEKMIQPLVDRSVAITKEAVKAAGLTPDQIDLVLMAGNATSVPLVQKAMEDLFSPEKVSRKVHPKHCVAMGAAIMAMRLPGIICQATDPADPNRECGYTNPLDATHCGRCQRPLAEVGERIERAEGKEDLVIGSLAPVHYGVQTAGDKFNVFVKKNDPCETPLEMRQALVFYTLLPNQRMMRIPVYGGTNLDKASANEKQGDALVLLPPGLPKGTAVRIKLWLNSNQVFELTAHLENGTDLHPWIVHGNQDAQTVEELQAMEEALEGARQVGEVSPQQLQQIETARDEAFDNLRSGDYRGAVHLARQAGELLQAPQKDHPGQKAENLIGYAEFVIHQYSWALPPERTCRLATVVEETKVALQQGHLPTLEAKVAELDRETDNVPDEVRIFLGIKGAIANRVRPFEPPLATSLLEEVEEAEGAFRTHNPAAPAMLMRVVEKVHRAMEQAMSVRGLERKCSGGHDTHGQRKCPVCGEDTWLAVDQRAPLVRPATPAHRRGQPQMPGDKVDRVHFSVTAPPLVLPGTSFLVDLWAHMERQREEVIKRAVGAASGGELVIQSKGPVQVVRGTILTVHMVIEGIIVDDQQDTILWDGEIGNARFPVRVPDDAREGPRRGLATIHVNGVQLAKVHFMLLVGKEASEVNHIPSHEERHRKAFASYASADRDQVLPRLQGIQKAAPALEIIMDVLSLRSGQYWQRELWQVIPASDIFYLFWSANAKKSEWVEREWRCALQARGLDFIDPVPLVSPEEVPPPSELASKHFNDWILAYMRTKATEV